MNNVNYDYLILNLKFIIENCQNKTLSSDPSWFFFKSTNTL